jgi:multiple sugar transport system permease protein
MATRTRPTRPAAAAQRFSMGVRGQRSLLKWITTIILGFGALIILVPLVYMVSISLKDRGQLQRNVLNPLPVTHLSTQVDGRNRQLYEVTVDGATQTMALLRPAPEGMGLFASPDDLETTYTLRIAEQTPLEAIEFHPENFIDALTIVPFDRYMINTLLVTFIGMAGMLVSCSLVAYGFSRFRAPFLNVLFIILLSTIMLPRQVTLIPLYVFFQKLGWINTLLPLIVPQFFANAYDVFLLRQFFMTISRDQDEAAKLDGASPLQILLYIILPQSRAALVAVGIFHFLYAWNDFYEPLIFLHSQENWTMAVGLQTFRGVYSANINHIMAASLVMIIPPIVLFFLAQGIFMQGVVITGSKG